MPYTSRIPRVAAHLAVAVDTALVEGARIVAADAQQRLRPHHLSGELEREVHVDDRQREGVYVVAGDPSDPAFAFYGHMIEHGTSHSAPFPFLVPALEGNREKIISLAAAGIRSL